MSDFRTYVTQTGFGLERDAKFNNTHVDFAVLVVGDGVLPDSASPAEQTDLIHQVREYAITIEKDEQDPNVWIARAEIPASDGGFFIKEAGIKTKGKALYAYARQAGDYKPLLEEGQGKSYTIRLKFVPGNADAIQIKIDPSVQFATPTDLSNAVKAHIDADDPHDQYLKIKKFESFGYGVNAAEIADDLNSLFLSGDFTIESGVTKNSPVEWGVVNVSARVRGEYVQTVKNMFYGQIFVRSIRLSDQVGTYSKWYEYLTTERYVCGNGVATVGGDANNIELTTGASIQSLSDHDEFRFIVSAANTEEVSISVDGLAAKPLSGIAANQLFATAVLTVRYFLDKFYVVSQVNIKTGNDVRDIGKLVIDTTDILRLGEYSLDGAELNRTDHPIAWAIISATSNLIDQSTKDDDPIKYAGYYGDGDGVATFTLPMVGGEFIRMFDDGRGVDNGRSIGSFQSFDIQNHSHSAPTNGGDSSAGPVEVPSASSGGYDYLGAAPTSAVGGSETRPRNIAFYGKTRL